MRWWGPGGLCLQCPPAHLQVLDRFLRDLDLAAWNPEEEGGGEEGSMERPAKASGSSLRALKNSLMSLTSLSRNPGSVKEKEKDRDSRGITGDQASTAGQTAEA